jgi:BMFP domain-containing protein YqiC
MLSQKVFEEISGKIGQVLAESPAKDLEKNLRAMLQNAFAKLDLVTREEFEVQQAVLLRTREKLAALETRIAALERQTGPQQGAAAVPEPPAAG